MTRTILFPSLFETISLTAKLDGSKLAILSDTISLTYAQLKEYILKLDSFFKEKGIGEGDLIATISDNNWQLYLLYLTGAYSGFTIIPIHFRATIKEIYSFIERFNFKAIYFEDRIIENLPQKLLSELLQKNVLLLSNLPSKVTTCIDDILLLNSLPVHKAREVFDISRDYFIIFTSGTTGEPKGVIRSQSSLIPFFLTATLDFGFNKFDNSLIILPLCHINAIFFSLTFTYIGATVSITTSREFTSDRFVESLLRFKPTFVSLIPTHYYILGRAKEKVKAVSHCLKKVLCSSAPVSVELKALIKELFPSSFLFEEYGSTEAGRVTMLRPEESNIKLGSIGKEVTGCLEIKLIDEEGKEIGNSYEIGEIWCRTVSQCDGIIMDGRNFQITKSDFIKTGDLAYRDNDGYYYFMGRKVETIMSGGEKVFPVEVEKEVKKILNDSVEDVIVIGITDNKWGERVTAVLVEPKGEIDIDALKKGLKETISSYKIPKEFIPISKNQLPLLYNGKIDKKKLRKMLEEGTIKK